MLRTTYSSRNFETTPVPQAVLPRPILWLKRALYWLDRPGPKDQPG